MSPAELLVTSNAIRATIHKISNRLIALNMSVGDCRRNESLEHLDVVMSNVHLLAELASCLPKEEQT